MASFSHTDRSPVVAEETLPVSIVIPNLNGGDMLTRCLESIKDARPHEVILVDNASTDGSPDAAGRVYPSIEIVRNPTNRGFAASCNQGAAVATGTLLLFLNNDAQITVEDLNILVESALTDERRAVWQPVNLAQDGSIDSAGDLFTWWGFFLHLKEPASGGSIFAAKGPALLVRRDVFEEIGGFDTSFFAYFEESDLCWRARMAGHEVRCVLESKVIHLGGVTTKRIFSPHEVRYLSFRNRFRTILANSSVWSAIRIVPLHVLGCLATAVAFAARGRLRSAGSVLSGLVWPLMNWSQMRDHRMRSQALRRVADNEIFRRDLVASLRPDRALRMLRGQLGRWERTAQ